MGFHTCTAVARSLCASWAFLLYVVVQKHISWLKPKLHFLEFDVVGLLYNIVTVIVIATTVFMVRDVARNLIWVGINCTISNLSWVKETKQPHKKFKVD